MKAIVGCERTGEVGEVEWEGWECLARKIDGVVEDEGIELPDEDDEVLLVNI